jgi:hypothetical protein
LRKLLFEKQNAAQSPDQTLPSAVSPSKVASGGTGQTTNNPVVQKNYWMTSSSGKRHNNKCRYYGTSTGRQCGPGEGTACKICGG